MKKIYLLLPLLLAACAGYSQLSRGGRPYSFNSILNDRVDAVKVLLPRLQADSLRRAAIAAYRKGAPLPAGIILPVQLTPANSGVWSNLPNGGRIWRLQVEVPGAPATSLYYDDFYLPEGASLFVYNLERTHVIGSFGAHNNSAARRFATEIVYTDAMIVEYYEPAGVRQSGTFTISGVANVYNAPAPPAPIRLKDAGYYSASASGSCNVNVNCPEGDGWTNQRNAVARILLKKGNGQYWCSGALVNNTRADFKGYFLTANHCGADASAADKSQWLFYFNYQGATCSSTTSQPDYNTLTGCTMLASSSNGANSDVSGSDFLLVEFSNSLPPNYNVFYAGWDASGAGSNNGVGIHHPAGDIKKISTYTTALTSTSYDGQVSDSHWQADWVPTASGYGITEGGSSGSPLFNSTGQVLGQLSGGTSVCNAAPADQKDYYGKMSYNWTSNGSSATQQLKPWLDPGNTGTTSLAGSTPCYTDVTITGAYFTNLTRCSTWIKTSGQTTISSSTTVQLNADPTNGYILLAPAAADFVLAAPGSSGQFLMQALSGCK